MKSIIAILFLSIFWSVLFISLGVFTGWLTLAVPSGWMVNPVATLYQHLRMSVIPFGGLILLYGWLIFRMRKRLAQPGTMLSDLTFYDRLLNITISMFFGVGVIWTAIGMETALMRALNGVGQESESATLTAWGLLERLVNGGLLLALSTTVFGGVCGYSFRLLKVVLIGRQWDRFVLKEADSNG
ncbi:hypothetical protein DSCO28_36530 [Desulfosarcina ovata subsp. sediminis]|uniref:MotA/TolQ/ExbB proton channel domain-containing protein n=1 Tax=Desulfosarcina ovata subsp. sediminis TaxID=885957 RepID=A0A5K7ZS96_9BACT|nr:hypothetical protein [Desulfosarcina ovata]BBO83087.1 hypothetical protein DSCO28_36530 [Desulfosarcina ovata subsp. sediminis]